MAAMLVNRGFLTQGNKKLNAFHASAPKRTYVTMLQPTRLGYSDAFSDIAHLSRCNRFHATLLSRFMKPHIKLNYIK